MAAKKPWSELSDAYKARLARAGVGPNSTAQSRQRARGHRAGEHKIRRAGGAKKLVAEGKLAPAAKPQSKKSAAAQAKKAPPLTAADIRYAKRLGAELAARGGGYQDDPEGAGEQAVRDMHRMGAVRFKAEVKTWRRLMRRWAASPDRDDPNVAVGMAALEALSREGGFVDTKWYFYH